MPALRDTALAKVNLTLEVLGRRADGFHEIASLVAFPEIGDEIELEPDHELSLTAEGPFACDLAGDNLVIEAAKAVLASAPGLKLGRFRLLKRLPVAAGLGGGSADAAAALRLIARANPGSITEAELARLASRIGSDVSVCLASRPALICGRGEKVEPVREFPTCAVLLANPGRPLATEAVYAALGAKPLTKSPRRDATSLAFGDFEALLDYALPRGNDLEGPVAALVPETREVLAALNVLPGARIARLSGSGPTCFALFMREAEAKHACATLIAQHPDWWVTASRLGS
jgi:4-diphosphocytidyl-2-C-methyl-D-erythritol kinase